MLEKSREGKNITADCDLTSANVYIWLGLLTIPFIIFMFFIAYDASQRYSLQTGAEFFYFILIALYLRRRIEFENS